MRRWERLLDIYIEEYRARGVSEATVGTRSPAWNGGVVG
jgi:hypothetical protein